MSARFASHVISGEFVIFEDGNSVILGSDEIDNLISALIAHKKQRENWNDKKEKAEAFGASQASQ